MTLQKTLMAVNCSVWAQFKSGLAVIIMMWSASALADMPDEFTTVYIQQDNGAIITLDKVITNLAGTVEAVAGTKNSYDIDMDGKKYRLNLDSKSGIADTVNFFFPEKIKASFTFTAAVPNNQIYIDNKFINITTDGAGNADIPELYLLSGMHRIQLMRFNLTNATANLNIVEKSKIECIVKMGIGMRCTIEADSTEDQSSS